MTQLILALAAALAFLTAGASAPSDQPVGIVNPADVTSPGPI